MHGREIPGNISMSVSVLTMGFWPTYQPVSAILPAEVNIFFFLFLSLHFPRLPLALSITRNIYEILFK